jgi:site-specific DNA-methyltransferase (adenine-specific)
MINELPLEPWSKTEITILPQDCVGGMSALEAGSIDVVVTSPPYNCGISYRSYQDNRDRGEYLAWTEEWAKAVLRVLSDEGSFFLNLGESMGDPLLPHEMVLRIAKLGFRLQNTIHWIKAISLDQPDGSVLSRGHFKPINSRRRLNNCQEYLFHFTKSGAVPLDRKAIGVPYADKSNIARWGHTSGVDRRCRGNTWFIPYRTIHSRDRQRPHPATFPVELAERCIQLHGLPEPVVMDPFLGIGSAAEAAVRAGAKRFFGFEIDSEYAEFARARVGAIAARARED